MKDFARILSKRSEVYLQVRQAKVKFKFSWNLLFFSLFFLFQKDNKRFQIKLNFEIVLLCISNQIVHVLYATGWSSAIGGTSMLLLLPIICSSLALTHTYIHKYIHTYIHTYRSFMENDSEIISTMILHCIPYHTTHTCNTNINKCSYINTYIHKCIIMHTYRAKRSWDRVTPSFLYFSIMLSSFSFVFRIIACHIHTCILTYILRKWILFTLAVTY